MSVTCKSSYIPLDPLILIINVLRLIVILKNILNDFELNRKKTLLWCRLLIFNTHRKVFAEIIHLKIRFGIKSIC